MMADTKPDLPLSAKGSNDRPSNTDACRTAGSLLSINP